MRLSHFVCRHRQTAGKRKTALPPQSPPANADNLRKASASAASAPGNGPASARQGAVQNRYHRPYTAIIPCLQTRASPNRYKLHSPGRPIGSAIVYHNGVKKSKKGWSRPGTILFSILPSCSGRGLRLRLSPCAAPPRSQEWWEPSNRYSVPSLIRCRFERCI